MYILFSPDRVFVFSQSPRLFWCLACCGNTHISPWWNNKVSFFFFFFFPVRTLITLMDCYKKDGLFIFFFFMSIICVHEGGIWKGARSCDYPECLCPIMLPAGTAALLLSVNCKWPWAMREACFDVPDCQWGKCAVSQSSPSLLCNNGGDPRFNTYFPN